MIDEIVVSIQQHATSVDKVRLFMDYDGTLADFAPTPDVIQVDQELVKIFSFLVHHDKYLPVVLSGRSLQHLRSLLPIPGLMKAGLYGLEIELPDGSLYSRGEYTRVRPLMEKLLPRWQNLLDGQNGFFLEDKGWSLALHARFASREDAQRVLALAHAEIKKLEPGPEFAVEYRPRFLEIAPFEASKKRSVEFILERFTPAGALPVYIGDDLNDEEAFSAILEASGICVRVGQHSMPTRAQFSLETPAHVRQMLTVLAGIQ